MRICDKAKFVSHKCLTEWYLHALVAKRVGRYLALTKFFLWVISGILFALFVSPFLCFPVLLQVRLTCYYSTLPEFLHVGKSAKYHYQYILKL